MVTTSAKRQVRITYLHIGNALLNLELALLIDKQYPRLVVEARSSFKSRLVETTALSALAERFKLPDRLIAARALEYVLRRDSSVKASLFQAYLAGLYAEHGANALTSFVSAIYTPVLGSVVEAFRSSGGTVSLIPCAIGQALPLPPMVIEPNYVGLFGEWAVARRTFGRNASYGPPTRLGADHMPTWIVTCEVKQRGAAGTKAFQAAAQSVAKAKSA
ncbi:hypothetical protein JCM8202_001274 [Rhodotorula sphaerocarpa]